MITGIDESNLMQESTLADSQIYQLLASVSNPVDKAKKLITNAKIITQEDILNSYISVKQINNSLTKAGIMAFENGNTIIVYNDTPSIAMSQSFPFLTFKNGKTYIFADKFITNNRNGVMTISPSILNDLFISAAVSNSIKKDYSKLTTNEYLQSLLMDVYTKFVTRILNKEYGISGIDKSKYEQIIYSINKFFLLRIFESTQEKDSIEILSTKGLKYIESVKLNEVKDLYEKADPKNIDELLQFIAPISVNMNTLTLKLFVTKWIQYYYQASTLAIDNIEYLIFMVISLLHANGIINIGASDIVKNQKNIKGLESNLLNIIGE